MITIEQVGRIGEVAVGQEYESREGIFFGNNPLPPVYPIFTVTALHADGRFDLTYDAPYDPETVRVGPCPIAIPDLGIKGNDLYLLEGKRD
ncbi:MAG: hypothetical protein HY517_03420 [Candidatus Aenigmarchaeota archaeon]|nr:hypothetical protein [Candidatus Aenigmarchaeota archaeon]